LRGDADAAVAHGALSFAEVASDALDALRRDAGLVRNALWRESFDELLDLLQPLHQ
jgi:hypothetical protein